MGGCVGKSKKEYSQRSFSRKSTKKEPVESSYGDVVILGAQGVGKTSIANRLVYNYFTEQYIPTSGENRYQVDALLEMTEEGTIEKTKEKLILKKSFKHSVMGRNRPTAQRQGETTNRRATLRRVVSTNVNQGMPGHQQSAALSPHGMLGHQQSATLSPHAMLKQQQSAALCPHGMLRQQQSAALSSNGMLCVPNNEGLNPHPVLSQQHSARPAFTEGAARGLKRLKFSLVDMPSNVSEMQPTLYQSVLHNAAGFFLVCSFDNADSLSNVETILQDIQNITEAPVVIIVNKSDICEDDRALGEQSVAERSKEMNVEYCCASMSSTDGYEEMAQLLLNEINLCAEKEEEEDAMPEDFAYFDELDE